MKESERKKAESIARSIEQMKAGEIPIPGLIESDHPAPQSGVNGQGSADPQPARIKSSVEVPFYESVTRAHDEPTGTTIRVWRREAEFPRRPDAEVLGTIKKFTTDDTMLTMSSKLAALDRVAAIEITDKNQNGVVIYTEW